MDFKDSQQRTPLLLAVQGGHTAVVVILLNRGANVKPENPAYGRTIPLIAAVEGGDADMVNNLLSHGADSEGALWNAVQNKDREMIDALLENGFDVNTHLSGGRTALWEAVQRDDMDMVRWLLARGADPHLVAVSRKSPFMLAEQQARRMPEHGNYRAILSLLREGP